MKKAIIGGAIGLALLVVLPTDAIAPHKITRVPAEYFRPVPITTLPSATDGIGVIKDFTGTPIHRPVIKPLEPRSGHEVKSTIKPRVSVVTKSEAQRYALERLGPTQYNCIYQIFQRESHWRWNALNRNSGAYGIPQALPGSKMKSAGADWKTNPITQVKWGIKYINGRYGSPCKAWRFWQAHHWY